MKKFYLASLCACALFVACSEDEEDNEEIVKNGDYTPMSEAMILCEGNWGDNNSTLSLLKDGTIDADIYNTVNGQPLGDIGEDILHCDGAYYVSVTNSAYLTKLNEKTYKEEARYACTAYGEKPRFIAEKGDYIYVSTYAGTVLKLQKDDLTKVAEVKVNEYPEQIAIVDNYLLCCNSGYSAGNTVSVIDLKNFEVVNTVTVPANPTRIVAGESGMAYILTTAYTLDFSSAIGTISSIDTKNDFKVETVTKATNMATYGNYLYLCNCVPNYTTYTYQTSFMKYDMSAKEMSTEAVFANDSVAQTLSTQCVYLFDVNPENGEIFVGTTDYVTNSPLYVTDKKGESWCKLSDAGGLNASRIAF